MNNPIATNQRSGLVVVDTSETAPDRPWEVRYDLDVIPVDLVSGLALSAVSARWQGRNSKARCERFRWEAM